ncbi:MAG: hypothetical protein F4164_11525, partial [Gemmatimonadales bacterium]|nr:hypothetical protein [Gemmatimonadales bacterium]MYK01655.1 hypothetical protein [Candidatus Palauibacter ramosifaciens]
MPPESPGGRGSGRSPEPVLRGASHARKVPERRRSSEAQPAIGRSKLSNTTHTGSPGRPPGSPGRPPRRTGRRQGTSPTPNEPVAIIGMACRFPGSKNLSGFWRQLLAGENAVVEGPPGAVIGRPGRQFPQFSARNEAIRFGAYVEDLDLFDAEFFRISPIEAQMLDPQQRMMLEVSWWALEDAA